ncbi:MAG: hypothetical protein HY905_07250 [Deltaproteobacteria bacterium]|nr:hypothetical protein [Deltaproteobacteria bacterium]
MDRTGTEEGDADSGDEALDQEDGQDREPCPDAEGDCGWRCCSGPRSEWDPAGFCVDALGMPEADLWVDFFDAERVMTGAVGSAVPPLDAWTWRADGSETAILGFFGSCRWRLECQDWCWQDGAMIFVIDSRTDLQVHVEYIRDYVGRYYGGEWPYSLSDDSPPPACPPDVHYGECDWIEIPERGIAYALWWGSLLLWRDPDAMSDLPVVRGIIPIHDLATHERIGAVDLIVPDLVCGPSDPDCP